jgi:1-acyl-sn-glycerol-3-phosphate acyltransferase
MNPASLRRFFSFWLPVLSRIRAIGLDNLPLSGGCIVTPNHMGYFDTPLVGIHILRNDVSLLAAKKYRKNPIFRRLIDGVNGIWINREEADLKALRAAREVLKDGYMLGVAPEGTRSPTSALIPGKQGTAYLASLVDVPIVPIGIWGTEDAFAQLARFRRPRLYIRIGEPYYLAKLDRADREKSLQQNTDEIMCRIAALIPEKYHGAYANHPRLLELLQETEPL